MKRAWLRFYAELNEFLPPEKRYQAFCVAFYVPPAVRDLIESQGVPHTEVDLVLVNGESVPLDRIVEDGARVAVYPVFEAFDVSGTSRVRPEPLRHPRFVLDVHLGRLAAYLRMAGFDAAYSNSAPDEELAAMSAEGHRILLTRDTGLLKRAQVTHGYYVRETSPPAQLREVVRRFDLLRLVKPFTRCMADNSELKPVAKAQVRGRVPEDIFARYGEFHACPACGRVYWKGSHYARMRKLIERL